MRRMVGAGLLAVFLAVVGSPARAADQDAINKAVDAGVESLKRMGPGAAGAQGVFGGGQEMGATALTGLTLLECGVAPDDRTVQRSADAVRMACPGMKDTYGLALSILFLDRLGDAKDVPLIESLTIRLLAGQSSSGGWTYSCPDLSDAEMRRIAAVVRQNVELVGKPGLPKDAPKDAPKENKSDKGGARLTVKDLPKEIQDQLELINKVGPVLNGGEGDNSNTQFATVALWVARRHGLPVDKALARIDKRYRTSQNADGGWSYAPMVGMGRGMGGGSSATMTCAGLLGLAVAYGSVTEVAKDEGKEKNVPDPKKDAALRAGLATLSTAIDHPVAKKKKLGLAAGVPIVGGRSYYFMWSLERVCVALDLDTLGGKDWYGWASEILVANQRPDGSWQGEYGGSVDTCFALLVLRRANLTRDLTSGLKGKLGDPGEVTLKGGGVGGDALEGAPALKSGIEGKDTPPHDDKNPNKPPRDDKPAPQPIETTHKPDDPKETESARMARELVQAPAEQRRQALEKLRDSKGPEFTDALTAAIARLDGDRKREAREALADRFTRMKAETLSAYLQDDNAEVRRAAALAAAMKECKTLIPDLIPLLADPEPAVSRAARAALKDLAGQDLGTEPELWKAWWKKKQGS